MTSIRFRILMADLLLLAGGAIVLAFVAFILTTGGWVDLKRDLRDGAMMTLVWFALFTVAGSGMVGSGFLRIFFAPFNPALRVIDRAGPRRQVIAALNAELRSAPLQLACLLRQVRRQTRSPR